MKKPKKISFKDLKKLSSKKREEIVKGPQAQSILSMLTPTQFAELFPNYYKQGTPDVGGFRLAMSRTASKQQEEMLDDALQAATGQSRKGKGSYGRILPHLSDEQSALMDKLQSGPMSADDMRFLNSISAERLKALGIEKYKDDTGRDMYRVSQQEVSDEEARSRIASGGSLKQMIDAAARRHGIDPKIMYGIVSGESLHTGKYDHALNSREDSYGPFQMNKAKWNPGLGTDFESETGRSVSDPSTLAEQADWIAKKIASKGGGARSWVGSQWFGYNGDRDWNRSWGSMGAAGTTEDSEQRAKNATKEEIESIKKQIRSERNSERKDQLAEELQRLEQQQPGQTAELTKKQIAGWNDIRSDGTTHMCGKGTRHLAAQVFGSDYFNKTLSEGGGNASAQASSLTRGNNYLLNSGFYKQGRSYNIGDLTPDMIAGLPPGAVVAFSGGNSNGDGHIQMKVGNKWKSDFDQRGFWARDPSQFHGATVYIPNEAGMSRMAERGLVSPQDGQSAKLGNQSLHEAPVKSDSKEPKLSEDRNRETDRDGASMIKAAYKPGEEMRRTADDVDWEKMMAIIRKQESGSFDGNYSADAHKKTKHTASGAYQFNDKTWSAVTKEVGIGVDYKRAIDAPKEVQDAVMEARLKQLYGKYNDIRKVLMTHFTGNPKGQMSKAAMAANGGLTGSEYVESIVRQHGPEYDKMLEERRKQAEAKAVPKEQAPPPEPEKPKLADHPQEQKHESPKPAAHPEPKKMVDVPTPPQRPVDVSKGPEPEKPKVESAVTSKEPPKVMTAETGGSFNVGDQSIEAYPIGGIKNDNTVVVNKDQQPLFTMNNRETAVYNEGRVDVIPKQKVDGVSQQPDGLKGELEALRQEMTQGFADINAPQQVKDVVDRSDNKGDDNPNFLRDLNTMTSRPWKNPTFERAMSRTRMHETGDAATDFHYSGGNKNSQ